MGVMEFPDIDIVNRKTAKALLRRAALHDPRRHIPHLISISDPTDGPPREVEEHAGRTLMLTFHDISEQRGNLVTPTLDDVWKIVKFSKEIKPDEYVLCHCNAGISRSSAAALIILATKLGNSKQAAMDAVERVLAVKNIIHPNRAMVGFADDILGYDGALVGAHASTFEGHGGFWIPPE
jgi:predicted protein tyrosine phosphatase